MTAFDYSRPLATANRLLARFGQDGKVRRPTKSGSAYNPTPGAPVDHDATFAVIDYEAKDIDGTRILATDKQVLLAPGTLTITPTTSDLLVEADASEYKIIDVQMLKPAGTVVLYTIQARR